MQKALLQAVILAIACVARATVTSPAISDSPDRYLSKIPVWNPSASLESKSSPRPQPFAVHPSYPPSRIPVHTSRIKPDKHQSYQQISYTSSNIAESVSVKAIKMLKSMSVKFMEEPPTRQSLDVNPGILSLLSTYMKYSAAIYCDVVNMHSSWTCGELCQGETAHAVILAPLKSPRTETSGSSVGIVTLHHLTRSIVVAFRGMKFPRNWASHYRLVTTDASKYRQKGSRVKIPKGVKVHNGFQKIYKGLRDQVQWGLQIATGLHPDYKIYFTGHSLGGALVTLAAMDSALSFGPLKVKQMHLLTYGSPRIGNKEWANWITGTPFVPHLPLESMNYQHHLKGTVVVEGNGKISCIDMDDMSNTKACHNTKLVNPESQAHVSGYFWSA
ncbi:hypothetical protein BASA61_002196 [Batrachochytrium salamandrivorans]|nr:hypothetical protein BASA61_002196 [Batrachochytrium salamandrivorans]KAH9276315.1 hypothetical protein BASA83_000999 [Batrachochytrium salamandrivorans]